MGQRGLLCTLHLWKSKTKFFLFLGPPPISKVGWTTYFRPFQNGRHWNLEIMFCAIYKAVRVTKLLSIHMFLRVRNSTMPIKNVSLLWKINKQLFKRIFRAFSVIFCVSPCAREGYCAASTHESLRPSFFCSLDLPNIKSQCHQILVGWTTYFGSFQNGRHWNLEITFCAITCVLRQLESQTWCIYICFWGWGIQLSQ